MSNPLLDFSGLPRFASISPGHIGPAIAQLISEGRAAIERLVESDRAPDWETFVEPLDDANERLGRAWSQVSHLNAVVNTPALRDAYNAALPAVTQYFAEQGQDQRLHARFKALHASDAFAALTPARKRHIENRLRDFRLGGANFACRARFLRSEELAASSRFGTMC
jgi:oligopeptidase A